jgi:hypothetical protein
MAEPVFYQGDLANKKILIPFYQEYVNENDFTPFMGGPSYPIHVRDSLGKGAGDSVFFSMLDALNPDLAAIDGEQLIGTEQIQKVHPDHVQIHQVRQAAKLEHVRITGLRSPLDFFGALRPQLLTAVKQRLRNDLMDAADKYPSSTVAESAPSIHRCLFGNVSHGGAGVNGHYPDGAGTKADRGKIDQGLVKLDNAAGMKVNHILQLKARAMMGGTFAFTAKEITAELNTPVEKKIRPNELEYSRGVKNEKYCMIMPTRAWMTLTKDPAWQQYGPARGVIEAGQGSIINGSRFRGEINGVMLYEFPELERLTYTGKGEGGRDVSHSLFMGAQAWGLVMAGTNSFQTDYSDFQENFHLAYVQQRGQKMLMFDSPHNMKLDGVTPWSIENGIMHSFTSADTDILNEEVQVQTVAKSKK